VVVARRNNYLHEALRCQGTLSRLRFYFTAQIPVSQAFQLDVHSRHCREQPQGGAQKKELKAVQASTGTALVSPLFGRRRRDIEFPGARPGEARAAQRLAADSPAKSHAHKDQRRRTTHICPF
jgi:hypothetical protein